MSSPTRTARLFVFGRGKALAKDEIKNVKTKGTKVGGCGALLRYSIRPQTTESAPQPQHF